jgi:Fuc2NAc and GlcNAc transferase
MNFIWQDSPAFVALAALAGLVTSWWLTGRVRHYALAFALIDHPNDRSSHTVPTPRGGGVAIVLTFTAIVCALGATGGIKGQTVAALGGCGLLVAMVGFVDDRAALPARWRFLVHSFAAVASLWLISGLPPVPVFGFDIDLGWPGLALATAYLVWMVNLYNFMDGIDGIAGIEAITVTLGGALCWWLATETAQWPLCLAFAASTGGFLLWNLPPARIFMGDAGSGFIGFVLGFLSLWTAQQATQVFWCWFILLGCFMVDATTTLVRRVRRGDRFHEAHRCHAYQYAARRHGSHAKVSFGIGAINVIWLLPIAILVATERLDGALATMLAYAPLVGLAFHYRAGDRAAQSN